MGHQTKADDFNEERKQKLRGFSLGKCGVGGTHNTVFLMIVCALLVGQIQACMTTVLKGGELCELCFNPNDSFKSCQVLNAQVNYTETNCRTLCCVRQYEKTVPSSCYVTATGSTDQNTSSDSISVATILVIVFFSIPVIICLVAMIHSCVTHRNRTPVVDRARDDPPASVVNLADYNMDDSFPYHADNKQNCSICLEYNCNIVTFCGHPYHSQCLAAWVRKKHRCPLCVTRDFNPITIYCSECFRAIKMTLLYKRMSDEERRVWLEESDLRCESCSHPHVAQDLEFSINEEDIEKYQEWKKPPLENQIGSTCIKIIPSAQSLNPPAQK